MKRYALLILCCYALLLLLPLPALGILGGDPLPAPPDSSSAPPLPESSGVETEQAVFKVLDEASGTVYTYSERDFVLYTVAGEMPATYHPEALKAQAVAEEQGYTQVLWLDGVERKYIEEVGTMNIFFKIGGEIVTPALQGSILGGITRLSCIELLRSWGHPVSERRIALSEVVDAARNGTLEEAFGTGTAAVISPVGEIDNKVYGADETVTFPAGYTEIGPVMKRLRETLTGIQSGAVEDKHNWVYTVA